ncbi:MAG: putative peptidoglycan binding domain-containing protein, partial [Candidatus Heimdallarchaeaceae archaeon]
YVDVRVDEHEHPIKELRRVFELYNLSLLKRDEPDDKVKLEGDIMKVVKEVLKADGFYEKDIDDKFDTYTKEALQKWMHTNNFEVKEREDNYMWGAVYRYIEKRKEKL